MLGNSERTTPTGCFQALPSLRSQDSILTRVAYDGRAFPRRQGKVRGDAGWAVAVLSGARPSPISPHDFFIFEKVKERPRTQVGFQAKAG